MHAGAFEEDEFFRAIAASGVRALLIGRRALIALGAPVLTRDSVLIPSLQDLIATKQFSARPKDAEDLRFLELLRKGISL